MVEALNLGASSVAVLTLMHAERAVLAHPPPGFFPTPQECALQMAHRLDLRPGFTVLDPSGGTGNLLDACRSLCPDAVYETAERAPELRAILATKGYSLLADDMYALRATGQQWDRIIANPDCTVSHPRNPSLYPPRGRHERVGVNSFSVSYSLS